MRLLLYNIRYATGTGLLDGTYSMACWVKLESLANPSTIICKGSNQEWMWFINSGGLQYIKNTSTNYTDTGTAMVAAKWYHVCVVYDTTANLANFYVNGNLNSSIAATVDPTSSTNNIAVGREGPAGGAYFDGLMKDLAVWDNVALTPIQVKSLAMGINLSASAYRPNNVSVQPVAWWKLNELAGNAIDSSGNGHDGTETSGSNPNAADEKKTNRTQFLLLMFNLKLLRNQSHKPNLSWKRLSKHNRKNHLNPMSPKISGKRG